MKYQLYPRYKHSGIEWLDEIPEHWQPIPIFGLLQERGETNEGIKTENVLSVLKDVGVINYEDKGDIGNKKSEDIERYKLVKTGDIVVNSMNVIIGSAGVAREDGALSPVYIVYKPLNDSVNTNFYGYVFQCRAFQRNLKRIGYGILEHRMRIPTVNLKRETLPKPPLDEQLAIISFLDRETAKIDALIVKQERLIELLQEKRQAIISHAVTKGLNPDVPMKDSGIEWLGELPAHWDVFPLKRGWTVIDCKHHTVSFVEEGFPVVSIKEVSNGQLELINAKKTTEAEFLFLIEGRKPKRGDIIVSRNATVGAAAYVNTDEKFCMGQDVCLITSSTPHQKYMWYQLQAQSLVNQLNSLLVGATFNRINVGEIKEFVVCRPPMSEQTEIAEFLDQQTMKFGALIKKARNAIELLKEHRTSLISAAVTGKIDVRQYLA